MDRSSGGYFEALASHPDRGIDATGDVRRGRVVARQLYVFDVGHRLGWQSELVNPVEHGCDYLFSHLHLGEGVFASAVDADTRSPLGGFSLYEQAFYLFALARLQATQAGRYPFEGTARLCLGRLRREYGRVDGGFDESSPATMPLKSNPHMHLLEAALAWMEVTDGASRRPWAELAGEIVGLCLTRFVDPMTGAVREYFDDKWHPMRGEQGRLVEPGHQFEWAWLLLQWRATLPGDDPVAEGCLSAAQRLIDIGERWGVDPERGIAINELWDDMSVKDADAKIWPQTERVKAWCAMLERAGNETEAERARQGIVAAAGGLMRYFLETPAGLWHEVCGPDGGFAAGPSKASSFYHVVCAIEVLRRSVGAHLDMVSPGADFL